LGQEHHRAVGQRGQGICGAPATGMSLATPVDAQAMGRPSAEMQRLRL
jgi:hypothetical protein